MLGAIITAYNKYGKKLCVVRTRQSLTDRFGITPRSVKENCWRHRVKDPSGFNSLCDTYAGHYPELARASIYLEWSLEKNCFGKRQATSLSTSWQTFQINLLRRRS